LRADAGFAREQLMHWCEHNSVDFLFGLAKNARFTWGTDLPARSYRDRRGPPQVVHGAISVTSANDHYRPTYPVPLIPRTAAYGAKASLDHADARLVQARQRPELQRRDFRTLPKASRRGAWSPGRRERRMRLGVPSTIGRKTCCI
jgi:hypothetical protein